MGANSDDEGTPPRFQVIEGGGTRSAPSKDGQTGWAQDRFRELCIEILRAIARGNDRGYRVVRELDEFFASLEKCSSSLADVVHPVISEMGSEFGWDLSVSHYEAEIRAIVRSSLQVAAESCALDGAARGRRSSRVDGLTIAIRDHVEAREERRRTHAAERHATAGGSKARRATEELIQQRMKAMMDAPRPARGRRKRVLTPPGDADKPGGS